MVSKAFTGKAKQNGTDRKFQRFSRNLTCLSSISQRLLSKITRPKESYTVCIDDLLKIYLTSLASIGSNSFLKPDRCTRCDVL